MADKRSEFAIFINTTPDSAATYALIGEGVADASLNMNPQTNTKTYIHEDSGTAQVESYAPTFPFTADQVKSDVAQAFLIDLFQARAVLDDAVTDAVLVFLYETPTLTSYPAKKQAVAVQFDTYGGPGGGPLQFGFTLLFQGDPVDGTFDTSDSSFTAS